MISAFLGILIGILLSANSIFAQNPSPSLPSLEQAFQTGAETVGTPTEIPKVVGTEYTTYKLEEESNRRLLALCIMGTAILSLFLVLIYLHWRQASPETMVIGSGLVLVIFATVLVVVLAKADQQLTAATGILGAIAGYLFGKTTKDSNISGNTTQKEVP